MAQRDGLQRPAAVLNATHEYRDETEQLGRFVTACCVVQDGARVQAGEMFTAYRTWCERIGEWPQFNQTTFGLEMKTRFGSQEGRNTWYLGVGLVTSTVP